MCTEICFAGACFRSKLPRVYWLEYLPGSMFWERVSGASSLVCTGWSTYPGACFESMFQEQAPSCVLALRVNREPHEAKKKSFDLGGNRTHDLRIRSTVTLPTEPQGRTEKVRLFLCATLWLLNVLKLFPVVCHYRWHGWRWIET